MRSLRKKTKSEVLLDIFEKVDDRFTTDEVLQITGIESYKSLKSTFSYIRHSESVPEESRIDVRICKGICIRMN